MRQLLLTNSQLALVSDEDYERVVTAGNWYADVHKKRTYAYRRFNQRKIYLHRFVLDYSGKEDIDHIDGNGLNCARENLRIVSRTENNLNNHNVRSDNVSGKRGVYYDLTYEKWKAEIKHSGRKYYLGSFNLFEDARQARIQAELRLQQGLSPR